MKIEITVLNYNGAYLLEKCLPSIRVAARTSSYECELVVVDNCSTDDSRGLVSREFKEFEFYEASENKVLCSLNDRAKVSDADIIIFLNNDLIVDKGFIDPLIDIFKTREDVFLSAARVYNFDGSDIEEGRTKPVIRWGTLKAISKYKGYEKELDNISYTLQAGFGAFDRKKFLSLGGYDSLYLPGILDDTDVCFRAWRRGYRCYYQPASHIFHIGKASFQKRFGNKRLLAISHRNTYFFMWKNIKDKKILFMNIAFILPRMVYAFFSLKWEIIHGFLWFILRLSDVFKSRQHESEIGAYYTKTDKEIFRIFK